MNSQESGLMLVCGLLALMILSMFSMCIAVFIFAIFELQESALGPLTLASMVGLIGLLVYETHRDDKKYNQRQKQWLIDDEIQDLKRELVNKATDFEDSRKNIARRVKQTELKKSIELKRKTLDLNDEYDYGDDYCSADNEPDYMLN